MTKSSPSVSQTIVFSFSKPRQAHCRRQFSPSFWRMGAGSDVDTVTTGDRHKQGGGGQGGEWGGGGKIVCVCGGGRGGGEG